MVSPEQSPITCAFGRTWDAAVVGAGPAGAFAAIHLAVFLFGLGRKRIHPGLRLADGSGSSQKLELTLEGNPVRALKALLERAIFVTADKHVPETSRTGPQFPFYHVNPHHFGRH